MKRASLLAAGSLAAMLLGSPLAASAQTILQNFTGNFVGGSGSGVPTNDGFIPPDTMGAAGPGSFVQLINGGYSVFSKTGALLNANNTTDNSFWTAAGISASVAASLSDPHILFDPGSSRWFASEITVPSTNANQFLVAVSNDSNPLDGFAGYAFNANRGTGNLFADYDMLGINSQGLYIGANMFNMSAQQTSEDILTVSKSDLLAGSAAPASTLLYRKSYATYGLDTRPVVDQDNGGTSANLGEYVLGVGSADNDTAKINVLGGTPRAATLASNGTITFSASNSQASGAYQKGGAAAIDTGDNRYSGSVVKQNGIIYSAQTLADPLTHLADIHILAVNAATNAIVIDQLISGAGAGTGGTDLGLYYPSLAINASGAVVVGYSGSGPRDYVSAYAVAGRLAADGKSIAFGPQMQTAAGQGSYNVPDSDNLNRWGDYSSTTLDPADPSRFWTVQEFAIGTDEWGTQITEIGAPDAAPEPSEWAILGFTVLGLGARLLQARRRSSDAV